MTARLASVCTAARAPTPPGCARTLAPLADALGLRLILYDHRGHGRSEWVARRAVHAGSARRRHRGRAPGARSRARPRARDQLGRLSRPHVRRAPSGCRGHAGGRRRRRQRRVHDPGRGQRACRSPRRAVGGVSRAVGRLAGRRRGLRGGLRHDPPALLLRPVAGRRQPPGARRDAPSPGRPALHHRARVPALRLSRRAGAHRGADPGRGRPPRLDLPGGPGGGDPPPRAPLEAGDLRAQRPLAPGRGARPAFARATSAGATFRSSAPP